MVSVNELYQLTLRFIKFSSKQLRPNLYSLVNHLDYLIAEELALPAADLSTSIVDGFLHRCYHIIDIHIHALSASYMPILSSLLQKRTKFCLQLS